MTGIIEIKTNRLILRQWQLTDFDYFAQLNSNKIVMEFYPNTLNSEQSYEFAQKIQQRLSDNGWGFWAVEIPEVCKFIGFVGLNRPDYKLPFHAPIEIGWRLSDKYWGRGYATEAALAAFAVGFNQLGFTEIVSFTSVLNLASIKVMKRLQMKNTNFYFDHPKIPHTHKLQQHCLYKITRDTWITNNN